MRALMATLHEGGEDMLILSQEEFTSGPCAAFLAPGRTVTTDDTECYACGWIKAAHGCPSCTPDNPVRHTPSRRCESGRRPHCTCDTCF